MPIEQRMLERSLPRLFGVFLLALLALAAWQWRNGPPVAASMLDLLPEGAGDALVLQAEQRMQEPLNRDLMLLIHHSDEEVAVGLAEEIADRLRAAGFSEVGVEGTGASRSAQAIWANDDATAEMPSQVLSVTEIELA